MAPRKWALVTGVSKNGMGEGEVFAFLERGVSVIATAVDLQLLDYLGDIEKDFQKYGAALVRQQLDVTSTDSIARAVDRLRHITGGRLDFVMSMTMVNHDLKLSLTHRVKTMPVTDTTCLLWMSIWRRPGRSMKLTSGESYR